MLTCIVLSTIYALNFGFCTIIIHIHLLIYAWLDELMYVLYIRVNAYVFNVVSWGTMWFASCSAQML